MANLPNNVFRFIQQEETSGLSSFSESLLQGIGGDLNYINAQYAFWANNIANFFGAGGVRISPFFISAGTPFIVSPNSKDIIAAFIVPEMNGDIKSVRAAVIDGARTYLINFGGSVSATVAGNQLQVTGWGHEWSGWMLFEA